MDSRVFEPEMRQGLPVSEVPFANVDEARLTRVVGEHFDVLWRFLRRLGVPDGELDDTVQEVVLVLARKLELVRSGSERAFVLSVAFRVASGLRRVRRRRREVSDEELVELETSAAGPEQQLEQRRLAALLDRALGELPLELRAVFVLYELEQLTMAEIATTLALPPGTVASRLRRARQKFEAVAAELSPGREGEP
jgi:RNA polymerase sigma-70 factor (ECF subfamily)